MNKPYILAKAEGPRPLSDEEIAFVSGADEPEQVDPFNPPYEPAYTTGFTWRGGERHNDQGPGY